jgi:hypothetical protein
MVRPLRAGTFSASPQGVERPVNRCTQALHRTAFTPLERRGKIVDMIASVGVFVAAATIAGARVPALPSQGIVVSDRSGITFVDLGGTRLGHVDGLHFASEYVLGLGLPRFKDARGRLWALDRAQRRFASAGTGLPLAAGATIAFSNRARGWLVRQHGRVVMRTRVGREFPFLAEDRDVVSTARRALDLLTGRLIELPGGCVVASRRAANWILLCGRIASGTLLPTSIERLISGRRRLIVGPPVRRGPDGQIHGHWVYASVSPDTHQLLAQWSGECEVPTAFLVQGRKARPFGSATYAGAPESDALGWLRDGRAVVHFPVGACGGSFRRPGTYVVARPGKPRLVVATGRFTSVAMWGG